MQSVEVGALLLRALADADGPRSLGALARAAGMSSAKAHRYLVSYVQAGLVVQSERSGGYDLGPLAVRIGLAALERFDAVRVAGERLGELRDAVDATSAIAVWTDAGPTVARIELSKHPVTLAVRVGTTYPLRTTATGRIFLAFAPDAVAAGMQPVDLDDPQVAGIQADVRARHLARVDETFLVGVSAMAAPLWHQDGRLAAAVTVIGRAGALDLDWDGPTARALLAFTAGCSPFASQNAFRNP
ncbi:IclR family transcriptional regulator [Vulcanimicrobium alpinum]|uniref:IclR family transcriptional regulator n=1 Tax=Vulcanimicrobium alpinum TaxID=3016050 RepID=A0AAN2CAT7_UNVUL|nr:helix-turn-helix domain-containing protein [Vulcanimicrobium alpinum]BDE08010.1 IclR family transcriptional regulator [Vulcanimicrobium alpinum]